MSDSESSPWMNQCPMCGSEIPLNAPRCWLCGEIQANLTRSGPQPFDSRAERVLKLVSSIVILLTVGLVWLSVAAEEPGLGIALLIILIAPIIRTTYVMNERVRQQKANSKIELLFIFSISLLVTLLLLLLVGVVAFGAFCATCLMAVGVAGQSQAELAIIFAGIAALAAGGGLIWLLWQPMISRRIRKDIEKE